MTAGTEKNNHSSSEDTAILPGLSESDVLRFAAENWPQGSISPGLPAAERLPGDGSDRIFIRVRHGGSTAITVIGPDPAENRSYDFIGRHLWDTGGFGPCFYGTDLNRGLFLVEDLGATSLHDLAARASGGDRTGLYGQAVVLLARLHRDASAAFNPAWCYQTPEYDHRLIAERETGYFLKAFINGYLGLDTGPEELAGEFETLARSALMDRQRGFMHRDFQSRNIMSTDGRLRVIDFQGGRIGPPGYDLASLLQDPYVRLEEGLKEDLLKRYIREREALGGFDAEGFAGTYPYLCACRLLQALGAFGFLTQVKKKMHFEANIYPALQTLSGLIQGKRFDFSDRLRYLVQRALVTMEKRI